MSAGLAQQPSCRWPINGTGWMAVTWKLMVALDSIVSKYFPAIWVAGIVGRLVVSLVYWATPDEADSGRLLKMRSLYRFA